MYHKRIVADEGPFSVSNCGLAGRSSHFAQNRAKRAVDILISASVLLFFLPVLLGIAFLIYLESPGPILFRQRRGGLDGSPFVIFKFRTMHVVEDGAAITQACRGDSRITRVGAFLRRTSLDELPQLLNVLRGEMSIVGPRPHAIAHDVYYGALLPNYTRRTAVRPGLTGLAQVRGHRGETSDLQAMAERVAHDLRYIESWSLWLDLKLMVLTLVKVPFDQRAY